VKQSILEIYKEDVTRFRTLVGTDLDEDPHQKLDRGETPQLKALRLHNGTIYRWNRACYGVLDGKAHLRIENRVLPSGPTVVDEVANAALWLGLMSELGATIEDVTQRMEFEHAQMNFLAAARQGIENVGAEVELVEVPQPRAAYGVKGVGEIGLVPTAGAVAGALHMVDGVWRNTLPMRRTAAGDD